MVDDGRRGFEHRFDNKKDIIVSEVSCMWVVDIRKNLLLLLVTFLLKLNILEYNIIQTIALSKILL